jgi:hypothetical protein
MHIKEEFIKVVKTKIERILGVGLVIAMLASLFVMASPTPAGAAVGTLRFETIPLPKFGSAGYYVLTPDTELGPIAVAPDGKTLFASANITDTNNVNTLLKSGDGGYTWTLQTGFRTTATTATDNTCLVDIMVSPQYATDATVFVATESRLYQSIDGGTTFSSMGGPYTSQTITDFDVTMDSTGRQAVLVGTKGTTPGGNVYAYVPATTGLSWVTQSTGSTWATPYDVLAVAFSPKFASDGGIFAVTTNATDTRIKAAFGYTAAGGGWGLTIGDARFLQASGANITSATRAAIDFPSDFDIGSLTSNIAFVGLSAGTDSDPSAMYGDAFRVTFRPSTSGAVDLNVRGTISALSPTATNVYSIAVSGTAAAAYVMIGTNFWSLGVDNYYYTAYYSTDSGATWSAANEKSPTGGATGYGTAVAGAKVYVVMAADFATSKLAWAATCGVATSAVNRTADGGKTWNQISLIDYADTTFYYRVTCFKALTNYATSQTFYFLTNTVTSNATTGATYASMGALWRSTNGGATCERLFSYANPTATNYIYYFTVTTGNVLYVQDKTLGKFWRSPDMGVTFPKVISAYAPLFTTCSILGPDTIWTAYSGGQLWYTTTQGLPWVKPVTSIVSGYPYFIGNSGKFFTVANLTGDIFVSTDNGSNFASRIGISNPGSAVTYAAFDPAFATNKYIYASVIAVGGGVWRTTFNEASPASTLWERIDNLTGSGSYAVAKPSVGFDLLGVYYDWDMSPVGGGAGGMWRSVNIRNDIRDAVDPPVFRTITDGLNTNDTLGYAGYAISPTTIFAFNTFNPSYLAAAPALTSSNYYNQLVAMADTLAAKIVQNSPPDKSTGVGLVLGTTVRTLTLDLTWATVAGATSYRVQLAYDEKFASVVSDTTPSGGVQTITGLLPNTKYYWRARANAPFYSPWSDVRSFTTNAGVIMDIVSPARGAYNVPVMPTLVWTEIQGTPVYDLQFSTDAEFAIIEWSKAIDKPMYVITEPLEYSTTYYWRVAPSGGAYVHGVFTTEAEPASPTPPVTVTNVPTPTYTIEIPPPVQAVPSALLYVIIAIGAILVIALIVLIVRTRRVG